MEQSSLEPAGSLDVPQTPADPLPTEELAANAIARLERELAERGAGLGV